MRMRIKQINRTSHKIMGDKVHIKQLKKSVKKIRKTRKKVDIKKNLKVESALKRNSIL